MAVLQSVSTQTRFAGRLRSSHALLGLLLVLCLLFSWSSSEPIIKLGAFFLFVATALTVLVRYAINGPEQDRSQPSMVFTQESTHFTNLGPADLEDSPMLKELLSTVSRNRRALPPPSGRVVDGEVIEIDEDEGRQIAERDAAEAVQPGGSASDETAAG